MRQCRRQIMAKDKTYRRRLSKKQRVFLEAFEKQATNISRACNTAGISRQTYYDWFTNLTFKERAEEIQEAMIDFAEGMLYSNMKKGKESSILFFLKTRGKSRGYVEKTELSVEVTELRDLDEFYQDDPQA